MANALLKPEAGHIFANKGRRNIVRSSSFVVLALVLFLALLAPFIASSRPVLAYCEGSIFLPSISHSYDASVCARGDAGFKVFAPIKYGPEDIDLSAILSAPSKSHFLGTDGQGRDVLAQLIFGARVSVTVGFFAVAIATIIGIFFGAFAGYMGGAIDVVISRFIEVVYCFPAMFLILALLSFIGPSLLNIIIVIGLTGWTQTARLMRSEVQRLVSSDFVLSARTYGASTSRILARHLVPNALSPVLVTASFGVAAAILAESALSFLGFGVTPSTASWGNMLSEAWDYVDVAWWLTLAPGSAIFATVAACNAIGEMMRDRLARTS